MLTDRYLNGIPADSRIRTDGRFLNENALTKERMAKIRGLQDVAEKRGQTLSQMALNWVLKDHEVTSVLVGADARKEQSRKVKKVPVRSLGAEPGLILSGSTVHIAFE